MAFPNSFVETPTPITVDLGVYGNEALASLQEKELDVVAGLNPYYAGAIGIMGQQEHIREYCPRDATPARFATVQSTEAWLTKGGGRAMFLLVRHLKDKEGAPVGDRLEGYAWTGYEECEFLPDHPITSAYRLGKSALGQHLSVDFTQVVVSATGRMFAEGRGIGLETWKSNHAKKAYSKVGFELVHTGELEERPTLSPEPVLGTVLDQRLFMALPNELI